MIIHSLQSKSEANIVTVRYIRQVYWIGISDEKHLHSPAADPRPRTRRMSAVSVRAAPSRRTASKASRRLQLIQATIQSIAKYGLSDTTIATVSREANLSQGIINLHFQTKERLLVETLEFVAGEYKETWEKALTNAGPSPAARLQALLSVDYDPSVFDRDKIAVWFAFWSETKSRPTYRKLCAERDRGYDKVVTELVATIIEEGKYGPLDPEIIASGLAAMTEGLWLDLLVTPREMNREKARRIARTYLACLFPRHFTA
jgi:TetR/AcrR family transcriptional repressor of bet genes